MVRYSDNPKRVMKAKYHLFTKTSSTVLEIFSRIHAKSTSVDLAALPTGPVVSINSSALLLSISFLCLTGFDIAKHSTE
jgi:hypothetical protein